MPPLFKPGMKVTFAGLSEPVMDVVSINVKADIAVCRYYDEYIRKTIQLKCAISSLRPAAKERK